MSYLTLPDDEDLLDFVLDAPVVLGPYTKPNGRQFVIVHSYTYKKTLTYPRYLWMITHREAIPNGYEVDHIDNDCTNNDVDNLQLLSTKENNRKRDRDLGYNSDGYRFSCPICGKECMIKQWIYNQNNKDKPNGPYCSRSCSNKTTHPNWGNKAGDLNHVSDAI